MNNPLVSIVIPSYNTKDHTRVAVESIIDQTYTNWKLLVCDDGSTDGSYEMLQDFAAQNPAINVFQNKTNLGNPQTRNKLFSLVSDESKYIAILDSDDVAEPNRLEKQVAFLEANSETDLLGSAITIINERGEEQGVRTYPTTHTEITKNIMVFDPFAQPSVILRRSALGEVGTYNETMVRCQDYDLFTRFIKCGKKTANLAEPLTRFRIHSNQGKYQNIRRAFKYSFLVRNRYLFSKQFFSLKGFFMWGIYLGGYLSSFILPKSVYAFIFDTLFVKNKHG